VSIKVSVAQLFDEIELWGAGYLLTVSDDQRPHLLALRPASAERAGQHVLRFDTGHGKATHNAVARSQVSVVFPPAPHSKGYSLVVDGEAHVHGGFVDVTPTGAVLHRPAP
jgi:hypothetical protein